MSLVFGYFLETSRANRLLNRQKILELAKTEAAKPGLDPMGSPWAWMEDPVPPGYRDAFFCPRSETFYAAEAHLSAVVGMIESKMQTILIRLTENQQEGRDHNERMKNNAEDPDNEGLRDWIGSRKQKIREELESKPIIGLFQDPQTADGSQRMKFIVFVTAETSTETFQRFLAASDDNPADGVPFWRIGEFVLLTSATAPLASYTTASRPNTVGGFRSPFISSSIDAVQMKWMELTQPIETERSLYGTHTFIILDETTAVDHSTALVVNTVPGGFIAKRAKFEVIQRGLLVPLEMLMLDLTQFEVGPSGAIESCIAPPQEQPPVLDGHPPSQSWLR